MFGVKVAPSFFMGEIATSVLRELLYTICELFIDDVITWGEDEEEFLHNLRQIFQRLREKRVKVNPDKCELGVEKLEFAGHLIDRNGISMSDDKVRKVLNFPLPKTVKELRSFVGLCNYFSDHIQNSSILLRPLHKSIVKHVSGQSSKRKASQAEVEWSVETSLAFQDVQRAIEACPTLFFLNDTDEVYLLTDASDYGIGAYLFQLVDGNERHIRFMSHS